MAHHDPHRHQPAAGPASAGAVRRGASRRCERYRRGRRGFARVATDHGQCILKVVVSAAAAARHAVRADSLERSETHPPRASARWWRPLTDPFSGQPENKATPASIAPYELCLSRLRAVAHAVEVADACLVDPRRGQRRLRLSRSPTMPTWRAGRPGCSAVAGDELAEYGDFGGGVYRAASFAGEPHRDLPVRRSGARCRRLGRGQEAVRGRSR